MEIPFTVEMLTKKGMSHSDANLVEELTNHILKEVTDTLVRMGDSAPNDLRTVVTLVAAAKIQSHLDSVGKYMVQYMEKMGRL